MRPSPIAPWRLCCPWCSHTLVVFGRGQRGRDEGSGVEAAQQMQDHVERAHGETWQHFLEATA